MRLMKFLLVLLWATTVNANVLTLDSFIQQIKVEDLTLKEIKIDEKEAALSLALNLDDNSWTLSLSSEYGIETDGPEISSNSIELEKSFLDSGTKIVVSVEKNKQVGQEVETFSLGIEQSLTRNSLGENYRRYYQILDEEKKQALLAMEEKIENLLQNKIEQYLDFQEAYFRLNSAELLYQKSQALQREVKKRKARLIASQVDVDRVTLQVLDRKKDVLERKRIYEALREELKTSLSEDWSRLSFEPEPKTPYLLKAPSFERDRLAFWEKGRSSKLLTSEMSTLDQRISYREDDLRPETTAILGYQKDESKRFSSTANRNDIILGINFSWNLGDRKNKAEVEEAKLNKLRKELELKKTKQEIDILMKELSKRITLYETELELFTEQEKVARRLFNGESKQFEKGRSTLRDVIDAQNRVFLLETQKIALEILYSKAIVLWKSRTDQLLVGAF